MGMVSVVGSLGAVQHLLGCLLWVVVYLNIFLFLFKIKYIQIQVVSSYQALDVLAPDELLLFTRLGNPPCLVF